MTYKELEEKLTSNYNFTQKELIDIVKEYSGIVFSEDHPMYNFYNAPASTRFHGAYKTGLVKHSLAVYLSAIKLASAFGLNEEDIDACACIFHDLVKANLYEFTTDFRGASKIEYNKNEIMLPHGSESLARMKQYNIPLKSRGWELAVAYHMGAFEHDSIEMYSRACDVHREVLLLHTADMMATKIFKY